MTSRLCVCGHEWGIHGWQSQLCSELMCDCDGFRDTRGAFQCAMCDRFFVDDEIIRQVELRLVCGDCYRDLPFKCDEPAKPEAAPMRNAESPSGVQALGSSGPSLQETQHSPRPDCQAEGWHLCTRKP
jgi:hypothetical protein